MKLGNVSEAVATGHPDMVMDTLADSIVDLALSKNVNARCGIEGITATDEVIIRGEVGGVSLSKEEVDEEVRKTVKEIGYINTKGFDANTLKTNIFINQQSADIAQGVVDQGDETKVQGWGDNGIFFGYYTTRTPLGLTIPFFVSKELMAIHSFMSNEERLSWGIQPDAKCLFVETPGQNNTLVFSVSHNEGVDVRPYVDFVVNEFVEAYPEFEYLFDHCDKLINSTGKFTIFGPNGDCGTVGRKLTATTYGGVIPIGGGALVGKCPSKADRSLQYATRFLARKVAQEFNLREVMVSLSCAIGVAEPTSIEVTGKGISDILGRNMSNWITDNFDLTPEGVIKLLKLKSIKYKSTAMNGHYGVSKFMPQELASSSFTWETL